MVSSSNNFLEFLEEYGIDKKLIHLLISKLKELNCNVEFKTKVSGNSGLEYDVELLVTTPQGKKFAFTFLRPNTTLTVEEHLAHKIIAYDTGVPQIIISRNVRVEDRANIFKDVKVVDVSKRNAIKHVVEDIVKP